MKRTTLALAFALACAPMIASAQNRVVFAGVGSSAMFNVFKTAALNVANPAVPGNNRYESDPALGQGGATVNGSRRDSGPLWVVWDDGAAGNRRIWLYLSTDSTIGVRAFFNRNTLELPNPITPPRSGNVAMPADVVATINGFQFNAGMTDITPEDAKLATLRLFRLGYSETNPIRGFRNAAGQFSNSTPIDFTLNARSYQVNPVGASPIVVFVNKTDTSNGGLGSTEANNINRYVLAGFYSGAFTRTRDIIPAPGLPDKAVVTMAREGLSGTYVTFEECIPRSLGVPVSQETGVASTGAGENPLNETVPAYDSNNPTQPLTRGGRIRVTGTSGMSFNSNRTPNALAYNFWSFGNFSTSNAGNTKYLTVDGVDPIRDTYTDGTYPTVPAEVTFRSVRNGSYAIWALLRAVTEPNPSQDLVDTLNAAALADTGGNFVARGDLQVFRSHRATEGGTFVPRNGNVAPGTERGADAGGAVFTVNADLDYFADTGMELVNLRLGGGQSPVRPLNAGN